MNYKDFKKFYVRDKNLPEITIIDENNKCIFIELNRKLRKLEYELFWSK